MRPPRDEVQIHPLQHLNSFLVSVNVSPVKRKLLNWDEISNSTKQRHTKTSAEIVAAVLQTVSPDSKP